MTFDHPQGLWLLALAVPILAVHFYRGRIRRLPVPTLLFWEQLIVEEERRSALRKLRHYASLLLNLLALTVLTSAVASPNVKGVTRPPLRVALVVDTAPAMLAKETDGRTRLERAGAEALTWLDALAPSDEAALYDARGLKEPLTRNRESLRRALRGLEITPRAHASAVAETLRSTRPDLRVVLLDKHLGTSIENRAWISGLLKRASGDSCYTLILRSQVAPPGDKPPRVVVRFEGDVIDERDLSDPFELRLDPSRYPGRHLESGGVIQAAFAEPDAFPLDDVATFVLPSVVPVPVVVYSAGRASFQLLAALRVLDGQGHVKMLGSKPFSEYRPLPGVAAVFDRCVPGEPLAPGGYLLIGAPGREVKKPTISDWDRESPLTAYVDFTDVAIKTAHILEGDRVFLESVQGPLGVTRGRGGAAVAALGFSLEEEATDFALKAALPLFLINWTEWVRFKGLRSFPAEVSYGEALPLLKPLWIADGTLQVRTIEGETSVAVKEGRPVEPIRATAPGVMRLTAGNRSEWVAVNFFDRAESDLSVDAPAPPPVPPRVAWFQRIPYAVAAALAVLVLLFTEWYLYHRGII